MNTNGCDFDEDDPSEEMSASIDDIPIGVATADGDLYRYVMVYDTRDHSRECFRVPLKGGKGRHVDHDAMPADVSEKFRLVLAAPPDGARGSE